ncbi:MAG: hypothetical protein AAB840_00865, partial [Patescibacteria group bacterium]
EKGFYFQADKHIYWLDGRKMTGVTTILNSTLAKPALIQWAANMAVESVDKQIWETQLIPYEYVNGNVRIIITDEKLREILEVARTAHAAKRDKSADIGTLAHDWISRWIKGEEPKRDESLAVITDNFLKWAEEAKPKFLASEKVVYAGDPKLFYAGTIDFICEIDNNVYIGDLKTSSGIFSEMFYQTAGYEIALHAMEPDKWNIHGHIIVNCTKSGKLNTKIHYDFEENKKAFLAALTLYRIIQRAK